jgi:hypothetical protein
MKGEGIEMTRRWTWRIGGGILAVFVSASIPVGIQYLHRYQAQKELNEAIASADAADPRWRWREIETDRKSVPDKENSALILVAAHALLPKKWDGRITDELEKYPPHVEFPQKLADQLGAELKAASAALQKAHLVKDMPLGHHRLQVSDDFLGTLVADQQGIRLIARFLEMNACDAIHNKDMHRAWESNRAILNTGRSIGDEPLIISGLVREAIDQMSVRSLERILAHGELSGAQLVEGQKALEDEASFPLFLTGIRGERAGMDLLMENIERGGISLTNYLENGARTRASPPGWTDWFFDFFSGAMVLHSHAMLIRWETEMVEAAKLQGHARYLALTETEVAMRAEFDPNDRRQILARLLLPGVSKIAEAEQRTHTHLACGIAALAAERFRLKQGRWPTSLDELVAGGLLNGVPIDLFDGNPLGFRPTADGLVIYSRGKDSLYAGTALDDPQAFNPNAVRVEFRLWDDVKRRKPQ